MKQSVSCLVSNKTTSWMVMITLRRSSPASQMTRGQAALILSFD